MSEEKSDWKINDLEIHNFKSIKRLQIRPSRVNIFIGKPNAGKSNLLEAIALPDISNYDGSQAISHDIIRYTDVGSLFSDMNLDQDILLKTDKRGFRLAQIKDTEHYSIFFDSGLLKPITISGISNGPPKHDYNIDSNGKVIEAFGDSKIRNAISRKIRKYHFRTIPSDQLVFTDYLRPNGNNLWAIIRHNSFLKEFSNDFFKEFSLDVLFDTRRNKFEIMRRMGDTYYSIDFSMTPDTFQRMLYYLAAIESNKNAVILFEEPEAQSYPPYVQMLAERIVDDRENQYFITTHSPFIVEKMLEHAGTSDDVKIFVTYYEDYQTKVHELTKDEIDQILDYNVDLFFNMEAYQK